MSDDGAARDLLPWLQAGEQVLVAAKATVIVQAADSVVRRRFRARCAITDRRVVGVRRGSAPPVVDVPFTAVRSHAVVSALRTRAAVFRPFRPNRVLRLDVSGPDGGEVTVGIVVAGAPEWDAVLTRAAG